MKPTNAIQASTIGSSNRYRGRISNIEFLSNLGISLLALALSALILVTGYLIFSPEVAKHTQAAGRNEEIGPHLIRGDDLRVRIGTARVTEGGVMQLSGLYTGEDDRAILSQGTSFAAQDYSFIEYDIRGRHATEKETVYLLWRTAENPDRVFNVPLPWRGNNAGTAFLGMQSDWHGQITEIGLDIYGDLREQPLSISNLTLLPFSSSELLHTIWFEWTAFRGWTQKSANRLHGTPEHGILSPTLAMSAWSGLGLIILAGISRLSRSHYQVAYTIAVVVPWIVLDLIWQANLTAQLEETKFLFAGKSQHEKHLADRSPELYEYAEHLKNEVLPEPGARIFLLQDSKKMTYTRVKAQYYLLPHNIFNYDRFPRKKEIRRGDYILVLGTVEGLEFSPETNTLRWQGKSLLVKRVDSRSAGSLYQVIKRRKKHPA